MQQRCPFAKWTPSPNYTPADDAKFGRVGFDAVVLHISQGENHTSLNWLTNDASEVSSHFFIDQAGTVFQLVNLSDVAWCNGIAPQKGGGWHTPHGKPVTPSWSRIRPGFNPNRTTVSIEHEGFTGRPLTPAQLVSRARLLVWLADTLGYTRYEAGGNLIGHCDINPVDKPFCPGNAFDFPAIAAAVNVLRAPSPPAPPPVPPITPDTPFVSPPRASVAQALAYCLARGSLYSAYDVEVIVCAYWQIATSGGIDPVLALGQSVHETSDEAGDGDKELEVFSSWWALRPRRNPAGLGVTGRSLAEPPNVRTWQPDERGKYRIWREGLAFGSWEDSVRAHIGRLLLYALPRAAQPSEGQRALMAYAMGLRTLAADKLSSAPTPRLLGGKWAPSLEYGVKVAAVAEVIRQTRA